MRSVITLALFLFLLPASYAQSPILVDNITPSSGSSSFGLSIMSPLQGKLVFTVNDNLLYITDGTPGGTQLLKEFYFVPNYINFVSTNNKLFFVAADSTHGDELWATDGTVSGTYIVKDILPGPGYGIQYGLITMNGKVYFSANDGVHGNELWVSDGTSAGTYMVKDIDSGAASGIYDNIVTANNKIFIPGTHNSTAQLWISDGTDTGTHMITGESDTSYIYNLISAGDKAYFSKRSGVSSLHPPQVLFYVSDGTTTGTIAISGGYNLENTTDYAVVSGKLYFYGSTYNFISGYNEDQIWSTDGTTAGTKPIKAGFDFPCSSSGTTMHVFLTSFKNKLYFSFAGYNGPPVNQLWVSTGDSSGTTMLAEFSPKHNPGPTFAPYPMFLTATDKYIFFKAYDTINHRADLWATDGTTAGTKRINMTGANYTDSTLPCGEVATPIAIVDSIVYFSNEYDTSIGFELYKLNANVDVPIVPTNADKFNIYPNPAKDQCTIETTAKNALLLIYSISGKLLLHTTLNATKNNIDLNMFQPGMYFCMLRSENDISVKKLVIER